MNVYSRVFWISLGVFILAVIEYFSVVDLAILVILAVIANELRNCYKELWNVDRTLNLGITGVKDRLEYIMGAINRTNK